MKKRIFLGLALLFMALGVANAQAAPTITVKATWVHPSGGVAIDGVRVERSVGGSAWVTACTAVPPTAGGAVPTTCTDSPQPLKAADGSFLTYKFRTIRYSNVFGDSTSSAEFTVVTGAPLPASSVTYSYTVTP